MFIHLAWLIPVLPFTACAVLLFFGSALRARLMGRPEEPCEPEATDTGLEACATPESIQRERRGERTGPVAITRLVKDDGRALILYTAQEGRA